MTAVRGQHLIVHVVYRFATGGLENVIVNLINRLPAHTYRHAVLALTEVTEFRERITRSDVEYISLHKGPGHAIKLYPELFRYFRRVAPSIVHTCNLAALEAVVPAWLARIPIRIHAEHGWDAQDTDGSNKRYRLLRRLYRPFVSHYVAVSQQLCSYLTGAVRVGGSNVSLIPNGVDTVRFAPTDDSARAVPGSPYSGAQHWVVGTVGRMQGVKNQTLLARAFVRALEIEPAATETLRLVMIGDGPLRGEAAKILSSAGVDHLAWLPGERSDVAAVLRWIKCFVLPSLTEGTSCTLQEAMACGLPVVVTAVGGNRDLVTHDVSGTVVPSGDADAMAAAILGYWRDPSRAAQHGAAARNRMSNSFSCDAMVEAYDRLFSGMIDLQHGTPTARVA